MKRTILSCLVVGLLATTPINADVITFDFTGDLDYLEDPADHTGGATTFSGSFAYDTDAPDGDPNPEVGLYDGTEFIVRIGDVTVDAPVITINVANDEFTGFNRWDRLTVVGQGRTASDISISSMGIALIDGTMAALASDDLPRTLSLDSFWDARAFNIGLTFPDETSVYANGTLTTLTPEPAAFALLLMGSLFVSRRPR